MNVFLLLCLLPACLCTCLSLMMLPVDSGGSSLKLPPTGSLNFRKEGPLWTCQTQKAWQKLNDSHKPFACCFFRSSLSVFACLMSAGSQRNTALCYKTANQGGESFGVKAVEFPLMVSFSCQSRHTLPLLPKKEKSHLLFPFIKANQIFFEISFPKLDFVQPEDLRYRFPSSTHPSQVGAGACLGHLMKNANRCFSIPVFQNKACWNLESVS